MIDAGMASPGMIVAHSCQFGIVIGNVFVALDYRLHRRFAFGSKPREFLSRSSDLVAQYLGFGFSFVVGRCRALAFT